MSALLFVVCTGLTIVWCDSMRDMGWMAMPGGWNMSMTFMLMPGESWGTAALCFLGMWDLMMGAMMLPSLIPALWRYLSTLQEQGRARALGETTLAGIGYFFIWTLFGAAAFPVGAMLAALEMQVPALARAVPMASATTLTIIGALQFTAWKSRHLACCRRMPGEHAAQEGKLVSWCYGLRLGRHCSYACAGLTAVLFIVGVMDLWAMSLVTVAITLERMARNAERMARAIGIILVAAGLLLLLRAAHL